MFSKLNHMDYKEKMRHLFILLLQLLPSCGQFDCRDIDPKFVSTFVNHLEIIKSSQQEKSVLLEPLTNAHLYMYAVTGIRARISDFDTPHYKSKKEFNVDVEQWEEWFKKNKCSMNNERADSLYQAYAYGEIQD